MASYNIPTNMLRELRIIHDVQGPRATLRYFIGLTEDRDPGKLETLDVEDFAIAFYTAYNQTYGLTY
jgi:hypothetical protein